MKTPLTDKFLWDLYELLEGAIVNADIILPRTAYQLSRRIEMGGNPFFQKYREKIGRERLRKLIYWLRKNNLIKVKDLKGKKAILITKAGVDKAIKSKFKIEKIGLQKRKDGKWIMMMFDIPRNHKKSRNLLRSILTNLGYKIYQHSVWITPYDVQKKTEDLMQWYHFERYVKIFLIEKV